MRFTCGVCGLERVLQLLGCLQIVWYIAYKYVYKNNFWLKFFGYGACNMVQKVEAC